MNFQRSKQNRSIFRYVSRSVSGIDDGTRTPFLHSEQPPFTFPLTAGRQEGLRATRQQLRVFSILSSAYACFWFISTHPKTTGAALDEHHE